MAEQKKKSAAKTSGGKTTGAAKKPASSRGAAQRKAAATKRMEERRRQRRRSLWALGLFAVGIFTLLGYFNNDGVVIRFLRRMLTGLLGGGFYLLPPMLMAAAVIIGLGRGEDTAARSAAALSVPVLAASFCELFSSLRVELAGSMFSSLWTEGTSLRGGGVLGGTVTVLFSYLFSKVGAAILLVCLSALALMSICGLTIPAIVDLVRDRRAEREEREIARYMEEPEEKKPAQQRTARETRRSDIDIPIDEPSAVAERPKREKKPSFFNKEPNVMTPDAVYRKPDEPAKTPEPLNDHSGAESAAAAPVPLEVEVVRREPEPPQETPREPEPAKAPEPVKPVKSPKVSPAETAAEAENIGSLIEEGAKKDIEKALQEYRCPPISLLSEPVRTNKRDSEEELRTTKERLELCLRSFGVNAVISNIVNGPSITRYEMELEIGVKLNKLTSLSDDIALALGVAGVRIAAIPNKISTVGIEVPNKNVSTVYLRDIIASPEFRNAKSKLTFAIGKNISGDVMVGNISKLPHLLVAGTTGSGKSVCLNSLILSLMYKASPDEVKFIMVDPKMVEFRIYNGIPHLLIPVVTEAKKAAGALQWAVTEMMKRYRLFSDAGARDIASYNETLAGTDTPKMPQIVVIIDELADLMMIAAKEVEESICRVAQMGRAAGVHLVIATQSPRADVITGLMKANIPSRIALKVASSLESRIILDAGGAADKLVGNGDMLYAPIGASKPTRIQGTWVSDEERAKVIEFVKQSGEAVYSEDVMYEIERAAAEKENGGKAAPLEADKGHDYDELLPQAADIIFETNQASVSMLQRRLKLGYARAARIVDQLEECGILGPFEGSKPRQILMTRQQWQEKQFISGTAPIETAETAQGGLQQSMFSADDLFDDEDK